MKRIFFISILLLFIKLVSTDANFIQLIEKTEEHLKTTSSKIVNLYDDKCNLIKNKNCFNNQNCQEEACKDTNQQLTCVSDFVDSTSSSVNNCNLFKVNLNSSAVKIANKYSPLIDLNDSNIKEDICYSNSLDDVFKSLYTSIPLAKWQYFGTPSGVFRVFPGNIMCDKYDHRRLEWYDRAIRKPMNIVFSIDTSGKMNNAGKKELMIKTISNILSSLDDSIWFGSISMSNAEVAASNNILFNNLLNKATIENKANFISQLQSFDFKGDYQLKDDKVASLISTNKSNNIGANCEEHESQDSLKGTLVIYFIGNTVQSDAVDTTSSSVTAPNHNSIYISVDIKNNEGLIQKQCKQSSNDLYLEINNPADLDTSVSIILKYTSLDVIRTNIIWKKYEDHSGLGVVLTASLPVYKNNHLLGVIGVDYDYASLSKSFTDISFDVDFYLKKSEQCAKQIKASLCKIEGLRINKCYSDSKSFEENCSKESLDGLTLCEGNLINNTFDKFYCLDAAESTKDNITEANNKNKLCCATESTMQFNKALANITSLSSSSSISSNSTNDSKNSIEKSKEDYSNLITSLEDTSTSSTGSSGSSVNELVSSSSLSSSKSEIKEENDKDEKDESSNRLYLVIILLVVIIFGVVWYMNKKQSKGYISANSNRELSQIMNQSNRGNYYA